MVKIKKGKKDNVYLWTGHGWGKTTSALGVVLRAVGHKKKVVMIQFMKGRKNIGEYRSRIRLLPYFKMYQFGRKEFVKLSKPTEKDKKLARKGFQFAKKILKEKKPFLLILDEINIAAAVGLLDIKEIVEFLDSVPKTTTVYLTGRYAPKKLMDRADYVTEIKAIKHPPLGKKAKKGIDY